MILNLKKENKMNKNEISLGLALQFSPKSIEQIKKISEMVNKIESLVEDLNKSLEEVNIEIKICVE
jgi:S-adenosylmethionine synthetase